MNAKEEEKRNLFVNSFLTANISDLQAKSWKPAMYHSYETMALADSQMNSKIRPCGFRSNGKMRKIKNTCLMAKIKTKNRIKNSNIKLAVCITMYNEDVQELKNTLEGIIYNYNEMRLDTELEFQKSDFVVVLICDGYDQLKKSFIEFLTEKGLYDQNILIEKGFMQQNRAKEWKMKQLEDLMDEDVQIIPKNIMHLFQVQTWDFGLESDMLKGRRINFFFGLKQRNDGKVNSHKWFFQGICKYLKPDVVQLLDTGTRPMRHSIYKLYKYMTKHKNCGGCCGEIEVDFTDDRGINCSYFVKVAQFYEYKMGHTPDKANESFFGFNSVLPGAYSMFRWKAIKGEPMEEFFKNVNRKDMPTCAEANEFLAEDRVMCLQIYIKRGEKYYLTYVPECKAVTDPPESIAQLMKQRRRWINGSLFGSMKVISNFTSMVSCTRTKHHCCRQIFMFFFMIYFLCSFLFQFFTVGSMYASIAIFLQYELAAMITIETDNKIAMWLFGPDGSNIGVLFVGLYVAMIFMAVTLSLTIPIDKGIGYFKILMTLQGIIFMACLASAIVYLVNTGFSPAVQEYNSNTEQYQPVVDIYGNAVLSFSWLVLAGTVMMSVFILPFVLRPQDFIQNVKNYVIGFVCYMFMLPFFINLTQIYAYCNLHDISWGNRPTQAQGMNAVSNTQAGQEKLKIDYQVFRAHFFYIWLILNVIFAAVFQQLGVYIQAGTINEGLSVLDAMALFLASIVAFKVIFSVLYLLRWYCRLCCCRYYRKNKMDLELHYREILKNDYSSDEDYDNLGDREIVVQQYVDQQDSDDDDKEFDNADTEEIRDIESQKYSSQQLKREIMEEVPQFTMSMAFQETDQMVKKQVRFIERNDSINKS